MSYKNNSISDSKESYECIVAMGISTGGPKLLSTIIPELKKDLSAAYVIVQHMPSGFTKSLAERLNAMSEVEVKEAEEGDILKKGTVYIAPGGRQLKIVNGRKPQIKLTDEPQYNGHRPAVNVMMKSLAQLESCSKKMLAVIMTGMGNDGLEGVTELKKVYNCKVIAQDQETCTVYGMPKAIVNAGLADVVSPAGKVIQNIERIVGDYHGR